MLRRPSRCYFRWEKEARTQDSDVRTGTLSTFLFNLLSSLPPPLVVFDKECGNA
jgi:hypothetical protein